MNAVDIILTIIVAAALTAAVVIVIRGRKHGKGCCGDCARCRGTRGECEKK